LFLFIFCLVRTVFWRFKKEFVENQFLAGFYLPLSEYLLGYTFIMQLMKRNRMKINLSRRLASVAGMVLPQGKVADIGTDHGFLPAYLVLQGTCPAAVASDTAAGPLEAARRLVSQLELENRIELRLGDGLAVLRPGEVSTVCLAGMGGTTQIAILTAAPEVLTRLPRLVLQPMRGAALLRRWLAGHGWTLVAEDLVLEEGKYYEVMAAEPGAATLSDWQEVAGPLLVAGRHPLLPAYLAHRLVSGETVLASLERSGSPAAQAKKAELYREMNLLRKVNRWLQS